MPCRSEHAPGVGGNSAVAGKPVGAAVERDQWIVAYFGRQTRDVGRCDIGRVNHDEIAAAGERRTEVASDEMRARIELELSSVVAGGRECGDAAIGRDADGIGQFGQQREQQRPAAGTKVGDAQRTGSWSRGVDQLEGSLDQCFGLRTRHQRRGGDPQR